MNKINKKTFLLMVLLIFSALSARAENIKLQLDYPSFGGIQLSESQGLNHLIAWFYSFIVTISGLAAFAKLVQGGFSYLSSAGDGKKTADAIKTITGALIGLLIVLSSYIIIKTINPELIAIKLPSTEIEKTEIPIKNSDLNNNDSALDNNDSADISCSIYLIHLPISNSLHISYSISNMPSDSMSTIRLYSPSYIKASWTEEIDANNASHDFDLLGNIEGGLWRAEFTGACEEAQPATFNLIIESGT